MNEARPATTADVSKVASWIHSRADCRLWAGSRVGYPIDLRGLPEQIEFDVARSWGIFDQNELVAFGQLVPKPESRFHLGRLIVDPDRRGEGFGRALAEVLIQAARASRARRISLNVLSMNQEALALYQSLGFESRNRPDSEPESTSIYMECPGAREARG